LPGDQFRTGNRLDTRTDGIRIERRKVDLGLLAMWSNVELGTRFGAPRRCW